MLFEIKSIPLYFPTKTLLLLFGFQFHSFPSLPADDIRPDKVCSIQQNTLSTLSDMYFFFYLMVLQPETINMCKKSDIILVELYVN